MVRSAAMMNRLGKLIARMNVHDRAYLQLRMEYLILQIDGVLSAQYKHVMTLPGGTHLMNRLDEAMSSSERFKKWFRDVAHSSDKLTLERYLSHGIGVTQTEGKLVRRMMTKLMVFLPRWLNIDIGGCFCAKSQVLQELHDGYRISVLQGTKKVFADLDSDDVRECNKTILQVPLDPSSPIQATVYIQLQRRGGFRGLFMQKDRKVFFDESFDPVTLLGFEGSLLGKGDIEMPVSIRLWPTPDCETLYQELVNESNFTSASTASAASTELA